MNTRIIDLIKKLIRHERSARKCSTAEEASAFAAKIQQLCIDHKIEAEQLSLDDETAQQKISHDDFVVGRKERYGYRVSVRGEDGRLMNIVAHAHFCAATEVLVDWLNLEGEFTRREDGMRYLSERAYMATVYFLRGKPGRDAGAPHAGCVRS